MEKFIFLTPVYKERIWGGKMMKEEYGYDIPSDSTGESWLISAHENGDCVVCKGEFKGHTLSGLWNEHRELFGNLNLDRFPMLLKILDAKEDLSIQVHPDDEYAKRNENGSLGKTECWYVLKAKPNSKLIVGHNARTREELNSMIDEKRFNDLLREIPVKEGDFIKLVPGTIHSITAGVMIHETQTNSDITYRVYDYDRLSHGKLRELHLDKARDVIAVPSDVLHIDTTNFGEETLLTSCEHFDIYKINVKESFTLNHKAYFKFISVVDGSGSVDGVELKRGDNLLATCDTDTLEFKGNMVLIVSYPTGA